MTTAQYLSKLNTLFKNGTATEHSYRGDLQNLIMDLVPEIFVTNEPTRVSCGAPDYVLTRKEVPVGYIEAKDVGVDLNNKGFKEQFDRYKAGLSNLIITDYLHFQFFKDGDFITEIRIGEIAEGEIKPMQENFGEFEHLVRNFTVTVSQSIKSPSRLAKMMAGKARLMADVIEKSLNNDDLHERRSNLKNQMISFQQMLIHDINNKSFADIYAQTIAYGMFAARYHDPTLKTFSRIEAAQLIPKSNPFLRRLFQEIAGFDLDDRLVWIVEELVSIFLASDVAKIMRNFGKATKQEDPVVHFYETFLGEYSPKLRKARGVWYTPQPVVNFIVRAVDDILKKEFKLSEGLADYSKTKITVQVPTHDKRFSAGLRDYEKEVHKVQILDPATGTGTFLSEVVKHVYKKFEGQQGIWSHYVHENLIPRLNGFELLMASYAMAHLQMDMLLTETGYKPQDDQRFRIFLTNTLEEAHPDTGTLFSNMLSDEADQANAVKRDTPVMVIIGNPPYSGISSNNGKWIKNLIEDYKYINGVHFKERKHWLNNDYIKFIRFGQNFIEKNGEGIIAFINPHGYLDDPTSRGMRWNLLKTFDKIYTIDLNGSSQRDKINPNGGVDENVFDIMQGVSINFFIKTGRKNNNDLGKVFHAEIFGKREFKYNFLLENELDDVNFKELQPKEPYYFFVPKDDEGRSLYMQGFKVDEIFSNGVTGIVTMGDSFIIEENKEVLKDRLQVYLDSNISSTALKDKYKLGKNYADWLTGNKSDINLKDSNFVEIAYRPFDKRYTYFDNKLIWRWRVDTMQHFLRGENVGLDICRQLTSDEFSHIFITDTIADDSFVSNRSKERGYVYPLYLYSKELDQADIFKPLQRTHNLKPEIVEAIAKKINHTFLRDENLIVDLETGVEGFFSPLDILDYIYGILHSPTYRKTYKEFLKIDFPRVPYPHDAEQFWQIVKLGGELRKVHLLESPVVDVLITGYPMDGDNIISRTTSKANSCYEAFSDTHGKVWINDHQYFEQVPLEAWEFSIGSYQPAQKWLKDRVDRELTYEDIIHYQKIIVALSETARIMREIDKVELIVDPVAAAST